MREMRAIRMMEQYGMAMSDPRGRRLRRGRRVTVAQWERGLLFRHGQLLTTLAPGAHRRWMGGFTMRAIDLRPWMVLVPTQEIPTADRVTVKVSVAGAVRIVDPVTFVSATQDVHGALYLAVQVVLRDIVATTGVDDLLAGRADVSTRLRDGLGDLDRLGVVFEQIEIKDIVLPAELKRAQAEVLVARAQGMASLERARGETAALRNLANAARMAAENPALVQLRLIQQLESSSGHTVVIGTQAIMPPLAPPAAGPAARQPRAKQPAKSASQPK